jgi:hypothetical protein
MMAYYTLDYQVSGHFPSYGIPKEHILETGSVSVLT